ncbi:MAG: RNA chaperone Hfq [Candidatus Hydrogenedentota bacterium]
MQQKIQDLLLNEARKKKIPLTIYLMNGVPVKGRIIAFDNFTILMNVEGKQSLIYKHAVSTIIPSKELIDYHAMLESEKQEEEKEEEQDA